MYKHVFWDWNGTLFDDVALCISVMNGILARKDLPQLTLARYRSLFTFPVRDYYAQLGFDFADESFEVLGREFMDGYEARRRECRLCADAETVLTQVRAAGIGQSVLSAYLHDTLVEILRAFRIEHFFERVMGLDNIYAGGKTEQGRRLMAAHGYSGSEVVLIGDTVHDHEVARAIGADCVLVAHGHHSAERLSACGVPVVGSLRDVVKLLIGSRDREEHASNPSGDP